MRRESKPLRTIGRTGDNALSDSALRREKKEIDTALALRGHHSFG
jgi:hypothetical protein